MTDTILLSRDGRIAEGYACYDSQDFQIGYKAFPAKEEPKFEGR